MSTNDINRLVGDFMDLYEEWRDASSWNDWSRVKSLASDGARAYNEGQGPSFHILAFDGYPQDEFHEHFLYYLLDAGFDPFMTVPTADGASRLAVFNHEGLAEAARESAAAGRMMQRLRDMARQRLANADAIERQHIIRLCHESIPADVVRELATATSGA